MIIFLLLPILEILIWLKKPKQTVSKNETWGFGQNCTFFFPIWCSKLLFPGIGMPGHEENKEQRKNLQIRWSSSADRETGSNKWKKTYMIISSTQNGYLGFISSFRTLENLILGPFLEHLHFTPTRESIFSCACKASCIPSVPSPPACVHPEKLQFVPSNLGGKRWIF